MPNQYRYPEEEELEEIRTFPILQMGVMTLIKRIDDLWNWDDYFCVSADDEAIYIEAHTGGWSGNEELIRAMKGNYLFWSLAWMESKKGGHYKFELPQRTFNFK